MLTVRCRSMAFFASVFAAFFLGEALPEPARLHAAGARPAFLELSRSFRASEDIANVERMLDFIVKEKSRYSAGHPEAFCQFISDQKVVSLPRAKVQSQKRQTVRERAVSRDLQKEKQSVPLVFQKFL